MKKLKNCLFTKKIFLKYLITIFPALAILSIGMISFNINVDNLDLKGLFIISLILLFPLLFLIQGLFSSKLNINYPLSLLISLVSFILILVVYMNSSAYIYLIAYTIISLLSFYIGKYI